jgi:hypothetical protein
MFSLESDIARNLLKMTFSGHVREHELAGRETEMEKALADLRAGFRFLGDLTGLEVMEPACLSYIRRNMDILNERGVSKVVRIIPDPHKDIGFNILSLFHYRPGIPIVTCDTLAEADAVLGG